MTNRSQKRRAVAELASGDFETSEAENIPSEGLIASSSKGPKTESENLDEIKTSLRKEIPADLTKILAENQKEMLKLIAPLSRKRPISANVQESDSEPEDVSVARTSTPVKTITAASSRTTPVNSRNISFSRTSRDRPKSAPYPRLKNSKKTSKCQVFFYSSRKSKIFRIFF